jgi:hypothetical protein
MRALRIGTRLRLASGAAVAAPLAALLLAPDAAQAHALVARQDLPIPAWLFAWGASVVLIVSFAALSFAWREPRLEADSWRPVSPGLSGVFLNRFTRGFAAVFSVFILGLVVWSGLNGTVAPDRNFSLTFVFVTFWLGMVGLSVVFGDIYPAFNPWRAIAKTASAGFRLLAGQNAPAPMRYPERLGRWPAAVGLLVFVWLELVYGASGLTVGLNPHAVAVATLVYTALTFLAFALFGIDEWLERGDTFTGYFRMFSLLAPLEVRDGRLGRRKPLSAAGHGWARVPGSVALVAASIGATSFDGAQEGALLTPINKTFEKIRDAGVNALLAFRITETIFLIIVVIGVAGVYWLGIQGMKTVDYERSAKELRTLFAHALIPIALAYLIAHYFSLVVFQEQAQFTYLLSDPLGTGANLFGTASSGIDYTILSANAVWYVQVTALVVGHVIGLTLAHDKAVAIYGDPKLASRSQYWMLSVMVAFTCFGLFLLSQANS